MIGASLPQSHWSIHSIQKHGCNSFPALMSFSHLHKSAIEKRPTCIAQHVQSFLALWFLLVLVLRDRTNKIAASARLRPAQSNRYCVSEEEAVLHEFDVDSGAPGIDSNKARMTGMAVLIYHACRSIGRIMSLSLAKAGAAFIAMGACSSLASLEEEMARSRKTSKETASNIFPLSKDLEDCDSVMILQRKPKKHLDSWISS